MFCHQKTSTAIRYVTCKHFFTDTDLCLKMGQVGGTNVSVMMGFLFPIRKIS